jgi:hypothetical protein
MGVVLFNRAQSAWGYQRIYLIKTIRYKFLLMGAFVSFGAGGASNKAASRHRTLARSMGN